MFDRIDEAVRARQPDYPPEQSMAGTNTFAHSCAIVGWTPGYAVCLHKLAAHERDKGLKSYPDCDKAITARTCLAIERRAQERSAGKALFYIDRALLREEMNRHYEAIDAAYRPSKPSAVSRPSAFETAKVKSPVKSDIAPSKPKVESVVPDTMDNGYAAAINAAIAQAQTEQPKIEPKVSSPSPSTERKGLSLLEIARQQMGRTGEAK